MPPSQGSFSELRRRLKDSLYSSSSNKSTSFDLALGPCAVENSTMLSECAESASAVGAKYLRGGAIKLRTKIDTFEGLGELAWDKLHKVASAHGLKTISEITDPTHAEIAAKHLDVLQIGARSMWNYALLEACADTKRPILLKRGLGATTAEWLGVAERIWSMGCTDLILCERGIPSIDPASRNSVDVSTLIFLAEECALPVWLDVSHSAGEPGVALALLQIAPLLGISGAMAEIHPNPCTALCDADQAIPLSSLSALTV